MNALELADWLDEYAYLHDADITMCKVSAMLRTLHAENEALKADNLKYKEWAECCEKKADGFYAENEKQAKEIEAIKANKPSPITMEQIINTMESLGWDILDYDLREVAKFVRKIEQFHGVEVQK